MELRPSMVDKSTAARAILRDLGAPDETDFLLCVGDGKTDEVVFQLLHEMGYNRTATVGKKQTEAKFYVESVRDVETLLAQLAKEQS